jgi:hypothetical protein
MARSRQKSHLKSGSEFDTDEEIEEESSLISNIKPTERDVHEKKAIDWTEYVPSYLKTKQEFQKEGFNLAGIEYDTLSEGRHLGVNLSTVIFFKKHNPNRPIIQRITTMHRTKNMHYYIDKDGIEQSISKEYLSWVTEIVSEDRTGNKIRSTIDHGTYLHPIKSIVTNVDNDGNKSSYFRLQHYKTRYYIPFEGRKQVEELIKQYGGSKNSIKFYYKPSLTSDLNEYQYRATMKFETFVGTWEAMIHRISKPGGDWDRQVLKTDTNRTFIG